VRGVRRQLHIDSLVPDHFDINPGFGAPTTEAWLADID
jgi:hypothetical protein